MIELIILSKNSHHLNLVQSVCAELNFRATRMDDFPEFVLKLEETDFDVIVLDCNSIAETCLKWLQVVNRLRPKIPAVIIAEDKQKKIISKIYEEGVFYLYPPPLNRRLLKEVLNSAALFKIKQNI